MCIVPQCCKSVDPCEFWWKGKRIGKMKDDTCQNYLGEWKVLQYFGCMRHNLEDSDAFGKIIKVLNHKELWDNKLAWYSSNATFWVDLYGLEHDFGIHGLRSFLVLTIWVIFLELSGYYTVINCTFTKWFLASSMVLWPSSNLQPQELRSQLGLQNTPTAPLQRAKTSPPFNECPGYDTEQSDGEVPVMLELCGMQSTSSLPLLPGPLWLGVVAPDRVLSIGQIELKCLLMWN